MHRKSRPNRSIEKAEWVHQVLIGGLSDSLEAKIKANQHRTCCRPGDELFPKPILAAVGKAGTVGTGMMWLNEVSMDLPYHVVTMHDRNYDALTLRWCYTVCRVLTAMGYARCSVRKNRMRDECECEEGKRQRAGDLRRQAPTARQRFVIGCACITFSRKIRRQWMTGPEHQSSAAGSAQVVPVAKAGPRNRGPRMPQTRELAGTLSKEEERALEEALAGKKEPSNSPPDPWLAANRQQSTLVGAVASLAGSSETIRVVERPVTSVAAPTAVVPVRAGSAPIAIEESGRLRDSKGEGGGGVPYGGGSSIRDSITSIAINRS